SQTSSIGCPNPARPATTSNRPWPTNSSNTPATSTPTAKTCPKSATGPGTLRHDDICGADPSPGSCRPSTAEREERWLPPGDAGDLLPVGITMTTPLGGPDGHSARDQILLPAAR